MPINGGRYFANPAVGKARERDAAAEKKATPAIGAPTPGDAHKVEVHKVGEGKFHTVVHHQGGSKTMSHDSIDSAAEHVKSAFGGSNDGELDDPDAEPGEGGFMGGLK